MYTELEKGIQFFSRHYTPGNFRKPVLLHVIHVAENLIKEGYSQDIVMAGLLHDTLEDTHITAEKLTKVFGVSITNMVIANTVKEGSDGKKDHLGSICRCEQNGDALIVKVFDIWDNFVYFSKIKDSQQVLRCQKLARLILENIQKDNIPHIHYLNKIISSD